MTITTNTRTVKVSLDDRIISIKLQKLPQVSDLQRILIMKQRYKLALSLGLCIATAPVYSYQEETIGAEIIAEHHERTKVEAVQQKIDEELHHLFTKFFDAQDTMPFSQFISKVINLLKTKKTILHSKELTTCEKIIKTFEENKHNTNFATWIPILITPDLRSLMSPQTRDYINGVSTQTKISALIKKLRM